MILFCYLEKDGTIPGFLGVEAKIGLNLVFTTTQTVSLIDRETLLSDIRNQRFAFFEVKPSNPVKAEGVWLISKARIVKIHKFTGIRRALLNEAWKVISASRFSSVIDNPEYKDYLGSVLYPFFNSLLNLSSFKSIRSAYLKAKEEERKVLLGKKGSPQQRRDLINIIKCFRVCCLKDEIRAYFMMKRHLVFTVRNGLQDKMSEEVLIDLEYFGERSNLATEDEKKIWLDRKYLIIYYLDCLVRTQARRSLF